MTVPNETEIKLELPPLRANRRLAASDGAMSAYDPKRTSSADTVRRFMADRAGIGGAAGGDLLGTVPGTPLLEHFVSVFRPPCMLCKFRRTARVFSEGT